MPELKWARNVRIEAGRQAGARPQELQPPQAQAQALRTEPLQGFELEESVATVRIAQPVPRLSTLSVALEDSPDGSRNQATAKPTKRTWRSPSALRMRSGFECNWLYPWRGRKVCHPIFPREHGVENLCDAAVSRHEMSEWTGEICQRSGSKWLSGFFEY
jgi:hypothetical protein